jgi:hypothetical protein
MVRNVSGIILLKHRQEFGSRVVPKNKLEMVKECHGNRFKRLERALSELDITFFHHVDQDSLKQYQPNGIIHQGVGRTP